jgi:hypothetical protein
VLLDEILEGQGELLEKVGQMKGLPESGPMREQHLMD